MNIHGFMQLLCNRYFEVLVDHKAIEYMIKSKTESPTMRLKALLSKLSEYTIELKYQKGSEMHTSNALSRLHNLQTHQTRKTFARSFCSQFGGGYFCCFLLCYFFCNCARGFYYSGYAFNVS